MAERPHVEALFHEASSTVSYIVACPETGRAAVIDPVLDYDIYSGRTETVFAERLAARVRERGLSVDWILETHVHADHLSAGAFLKRALGGRTAIGGHIVDVQAVFKDIYNLPPEFLTDGSQFDRLFDDEERFRLGGLRAQVLHTPGHTPACVTYVIGDAAFTGDTVFMPDFGTARCDFPAATQARSTARHGVSFRFRPKRASSSATITRPADARWPGRRRWQKSARRTGMCATGSTNRPLSPCEPSGTRSWACRHCCCRRSR